MSLEQEGVSRAFIQCEHSSEQRSSIDSAGVQAAWYRTSTQSDRVQILLRDIRRESCTTLSAREQRAAFQVAIMTSAQQLRIYNGTDLVSTASPERSPDRACRGRRGR